MARLIGVTGEFKDREYPLEEGEITIGRKTDNTILLDNPTVSSHHCVLTLAGTSCSLQDLDSTNGTRLNGRSVKGDPADLHHKDILQLGDLEFIVDAPELTYHTNEDAAKILVRLHQDKAFYEAQLAHCRERAKAFSMQAYMENQHKVLSAILAESDE